VAFHLSFLETSRFAVPEYQVQTAVLPNVFSSFVNFLEGDPIHVIASAVGVLMSLSKSLDLLRFMVL
jgi:hypothetical protein